MGFLDLIFHLKSSSDYSGKIPVLVKNQGTFYLKGRQGQGQQQIKSLEALLRDRAYKLNSKLLLTFVCTYAVLQNL